ncbi:MAG: recombinase family protein, partial [Clostridiales bacterium]|nr:recombinase family protein [Clostridiales bacterium]
GIAQDEVRKLSSRIKFGQKRAIASGRVLGNSRIWGYEKDKGKLVINESEAVMVRRIFNLYADGNSQREIERILWAEGYRGREGNRISFTSIGKIIKNPKYKGFYCGGKVVITDYISKKQKFLPEDEWTMYRDETGEIVPPLVSEEIWDAANRIMANRSEKVKNKETSFKNNIYTGKIYCGIHNVPFWKNSYAWRNNGRTTKPQWRCSERSKFDENNQRIKCDTLPIFEYELNELVKKLLMSLKATDAIQQYADYFRQANQVCSDGNSHKELNDKIRKLGQKKEKLLELTIEGHISNREFSERNNAANEEIAVLHRQIKDLSRSKTDIAKRIQSLGEFQDIIKNGFEAIDEDFIAKIVRRFIHRIIITPSGKDVFNIDVVLNTGDTVNIAYDKATWSWEPMTKKMVAFAEQALAQGQTAAIGNASPTINSTNTPNY